MFSMGFWNNSWDVLPPFPIKLPLKCEAIIHFLEAPTPSQKLLIPKCIPKCIYLGVLRTSKVGQL